MRCSSRNQPLHGRPRTGNPLVCPAPGALLEALQDRDVVQGPEAAGPEERRTIVGDEPIEPQPPDGEGRCITRRRHMVAPCLIAQRKIKSQSAQRGGICREHKRVGRDLGAGSQPNPQQLLTRIYPRHGLRRAHLGAEAFQIAPKRGPETTVIAVSRYVEEQSFGRPQEIGVEHRDELTSREVIWVGKEAAGKDLQRKVPSCIRKAKSIKEVRGALAVIAGECAREIDVQQFKSRRHVHRSKITKPKRWALQDERCDVQRRRPPNRRKESACPSAKSSG
jgi:hypothetical protein